MSRLKSLLAGALAAGAFTAGIILAPVSQAQAAGDVVTIGYQAVPDPALAAVVDGEYEKALGKKIEWRKFDSGASVIAALASGNIDIGYAGSSPLAAGVTRGAPIKAFLVAGLIGKAEALVVRDGSGIVKPEDFVGKKVAVPFVSTTHYSLLFALKHWGVDAAKVNILNLQPPEIAAAFARGDIDATYVWDPAQASARKTGKVLITSEEIAKLGGPTFVAWIARDAFAKEDPESVRAFAAVTLDTYAKYRSNPEAYGVGAPETKKIADFTGAKPEEVPEQVAGNYYPLADEQVSDALLGKGTAAAIAATSAFLLEQKKVDAVLPDYSGSATAEFVKPAPVN